MKVILNANIILEDGIIFDGVVEIVGDKIGKVIKRCDYVLPDGVEIVDAKGQYVAPGLIDIHNHGSEYNLFATDPEQCVEYFVTHGQTSILPTLYCDLNKKQMIIVISG